MTVCYTLTNFGDPFLTLPLASAILTWLMATHREQLAISWFVFLAWRRRWWASQICLRGLGGAGLRTGIHSHQRTYHAVGRGVSAGLLPFPSKCQSALCNVGGHIRVLVLRTDRHFPGCDCRPFSFRSNRRMDPRFRGQFGHARTAQAERTEGSVLGRVQYGSDHYRMDLLRTPCADPRLD